MNDRILTIDIISLRCFLPSPSIGLESLHRSFSTCGSRLSRVMSDEFVRTLSYLYLQYKSSLHATFSAHSLIWASYMWTSFDWRWVPVCFHFRAVCFLLALWDLSRQCGNRRKGPQRSNIPQLIYLLLNGLRLNDRVSSFLNLLIFFVVHYYWYSKNVNFHSFYSVRGPFSKNFTRNVTSKSQERKFFNFFFPSIGLPLFSFRKSSLKHNMFWW